MKKDFTLSQYQLYIKAIKKTYPNIITFEAYFNNPKSYTHFCIIRHDVDRKPQNALKMAYEEAAIGLKAVYYFRAKSNTFRPDLIKEIAELGHEIGYHYESLSDTNGDYAKALDDFKENLQRFREIVSVKTISMHGRPLKPYDNRDLWKVEKNHQLLLNELGILGEVYLDIDYTDIAYINDTGRNWKANKANRRDHVNTKISCEFESGDELLNYLEGKPHPKMVFQIHPERWTDAKVEYYFQSFQDNVINLVKTLV